MKNERDISVEFNQVDGQDSWLLRTVAAEKSIEVEVFDSAEQALKKKNLEITRKVGIFLVTSTSAALNFLLGHVAWADQLNEPRGELDNAEIFAWAGSTVLLGLGTYWSWKYFDPKLDSQIDKIVEVQKSLKKIRKNR